MRPLIRSGQDALDRLERVRLALTPLQNRALSLQLQGKTVGAIAAELGRSKSAVSKVLWRGRRKLGLTIAQMRTRPFEVVAVGGPGAGGARIGSDNGGYVNQPQNERLSSAEVDRIFNRVAGVSGAVDSDADSD